MQRGRYIHLAVMAGTNPPDFPAEMLAGIEASKHAHDTSVPNQVSVLDNVSVSNDLLSPRSISGIQILPRDKGALVA